MSIDYFLAPKAIRDTVIEDELEQKIADTMVCSKFRHAIEDISKLYKISYSTVRAFMIEMETKENRTLYGLCEMALEERGYVSAELRKIAKEMPEWAIRNKEYPSHYEVKIPTREINTNHLTAWLCEIEEENCIIAIDGGSYHFSSKRERLQFALGIELMFAAFSEDLRATKLS
jgi:hypothetical protein